jgi:hypothetical protein
MELARRCVANVNVSAILLVNNWTAHSHKELEQPVDSVRPCLQTVLNPHWRTNMLFNARRNWGARLHPHDGFGRGTFAGFRGSWNSYWRPCVESGHRTRGYSVLEMIRAFEAASGKSVPYRIAPCRPGDIATCYADPAKAERELGWKARRGLDEMMRDAWRWQSMNPNGFRS